MYTYIKSVNGVDICEITFTGGGGHISVPICDQGAGGGGSEKLKSVITFTAPPPSPLRPLIRVPLTKALNQDTLNPDSSALMLDNCWRL